MRKYLALGSFAGALLLQSCTAMTTPNTTTPETQGAAILGRIRNDAIKLFWIPPGLTVKLHKRGRAVIHYSKNVGNPKLTGTCTFSPSLPATVAYFIAKKSGVGKYQWITFEASAVGVGMCTAIETIGSVSATLTVTVVK